MAFEVSLGRNSPFFFLPGAFPWDQIPNHLRSPPEQSKPHLSSSSRSRDHKRLLVPVLLLRRLLLLLLR